ncbi:MAG: ABC transporter substrate-binding protein [Xanthobacteraceae bacterium]
MASVGGAAIAPMFSWLSVARAQQSKSPATKSPTIGVLLVAGREPFAGQFEAGLRALGHIVGQSIQLEFRSAGGQLKALPELAAELVRLKVDIIIASETPAVHAAKRATTTIPIVMAPAGDPVGTGLVASLARPGGNVTGLSAATAELAGKSLEIIREVLPSVRRVAALADPTNPFSKPFLEQIHLSARSIGVEIRVAMVRNVDEFDAAFSEMKQQRVEAVIVQPTLPRKRAIDLALEHRLPSVSGNRAFPDGGGLMSYAGSLADRYRNAAVYVDKILKGAKPADLPVQQPVKFELVVNLKTAKSLGLVVPPTLLARADEVIE